MGDVDEVTAVETAARLRQAEALLAGEVTLLEMVARGRPLLEVTDALARLVETLSSDCLCSILIVAPGRTHFRVGAGPSLPDEYNAILDGKTIDGGYGPCSLSILQRAPVITADIASDPRWDGSVWPALMKSYGYASCWSMPIGPVGADPSGIFAIYRRDPVSPTPEEQVLIDRLTKIAGIAIDRAQADEALKAREAELRRANSFLRDAHALSRTGSFTWDVEADEHVWTDEIYRLFEFDPDVRVEMGMMLAAIHPEDLPAVEGVLAAATAGGDFDLTFRVVPRSGTVKHARVVGRRIEQISERTVFMGALQDVTAGKAAEEALNRARADLAHVSRVTTLSALTASIAHEVSQPVSGILNNASTCLRLLAADPPNLEAAADTARRTIRDANRTAEVIKRLRALFARAEPSVEPVDLNDAAREVIALSSSELHRGRVVLQTEFAEPAPAVGGDRVQLQQVILNLMLNAADAMTEVEDRPRRLLLRTEAVPDGVRLLVSDSGPGVDPATVERLFDAFYTTKPQGMGVGLAISRSIIENHGGHLWAASNDGPGATFAFQLPREGDPGPGEAV